MSMLEMFSERSHGFRPSPVRAVFDLSMQPGMNCCTKRLTAGSYLYQAVLSSQIRTTAPEPFVSPFLTGSQKPSRKASTDLDKPSKTK